MEFIAGKKSAAELSAEYKIPQTNLHDWRSKLLDNAKEIFIPESEKNKQINLLAWIFHALIISRLRLDFLAYVLIAHFGVALHL